MSDDAIDLTVCLLARTCAAGALLFMMPPMGEFPEAWQIQLAFLAAIAWCYWYGLFGQSRLFLATVEAAISLWISLKWTRLMLLVTSLAV